MVRICDHDYYGNLMFRTSYDRRCVSFVFPVDISNELIEEFKYADEIHVLDNKKEIVATHRLTEWLTVEKVRDGNHEGLAIRWLTVTLDEMDKLKKQITELETENKALTEENATLTDAILELAGIVGEEE